MRKASLVVSTAVSALCAAAFNLAPASAAPSDTNRTVDILGSESFSVDEFFKVTYRFEQRRIAVHQGATVTWNNKTTDGHTMSVVSPADLPKTIDQVNNCAICNQLSAAHFPNGFPPQGIPAVFLDDFKPAALPAKLDSVGDSLLVAPPGLGFPTSVSAQITAPVGTTLNYICAFHPWMQASIRVLADDDTADR